MRPLFVCRNALMATDKFCVFVLPKEPRKIFCLYNCVMQSAVCFCINGHLKSAATAVIFTRSILRYLINWCQL